MPSSTRSRFARRTGGGGAPTRRRLPVARTAAVVAGLAVLAGLAPQVASAAGPAASTVGSTQQAAALGRQLTLPQVTRADLGRTLFSKTLYSRHLSFSSALRQADNTFGRLDIVRVFYPGLPRPWPSQAGEARRPVNVSFKASPSAILSGRYDRGLRSWFVHAPHHRRIWWTYSHEPEDNIARGEFSAASYRAAWRHIYRLSRAAHNRMLRPTLTLMCWTIGKGSPRHFRDYYPGDFIRTLAWDCYNQQWPQGIYTKPSRMLRHAAHFSHRRGKGFAIGEFGSPLVRSDTTGKGRARWLVAYAKTAARLKAQYAVYFDAPSSTCGCDYRLLDSPSRSAWRTVIRHS